MITFRHPKTDTSGTSERSMSFNSFDFVLFFPIVVLCYYGCPYRYRWLLLLGASYYFYASWKAEYLILIIISTLVDYWASLQMGKQETRTQRRPFLIFSILSNIGILFSFKYFNFFNDSFRALFNQFNLLYDIPALRVLLPIGISFYTFQSLAYSIEVYRGKQKPERHVGIFALYVAFFPQLVAGPIERPQNLLPQFYKHVTFDAARAASGLQLMIWGFFKKLVVADQLALFVNEVFGTPQDYPGWFFWIAMYAFTFQVYCDFSGYSDIAVGAARVMGYDLMENFRRPFLANSLRNLWRRWHISLLTWFRDYLYIPLGGNRVGQWRLYCNVFVVFTVSGLWHGADWTFVLFGALHGIYLIIGHATASWRNQVWKRIMTRRPGYTVAGMRWDWEKIRTVFAIIITFHLFALSLLLFRANTITDAVFMLRNLLNFSDLGTFPLIFKYNLMVGFGAAFFMEVVHVIEEQKGSTMNALLARSPWWFRWATYCVLVWGLLLFGYYGGTDFIYFQF